MRPSDSRSVTVLPGTSQESPHNTLPPLTSQYPQWSRAGKMGIGLYSSSYSIGGENNVSRHKNDKVTKKGPELAAVGRSEGLVVTPTADPLLRVAQLEQNIRFLQEQHQLMLASLHQEVEQLRQRNRDLQFQLVFTKGGISLVQSSPSSPEDDSKPKILLSPKQMNMTSLQVEILERDVSELKVALSEAKTKNVYLSGIVDEQKKKLDTFEADKLELGAVGTKILPGKHSDAQSQAGCSSTESEPLEDPEMVNKLEEAEKIIRRLRRENEDQRRELVTMRTTLTKNGSVRGHNSQRGSHRSQSQRFPPLHTQSYWHHGQQQRSGMEFVSHRHCANSGGSRLEKDSQLVGRPAPSLPNLRNNATSSGYGSFSNGNNGNGHRRGHYNGNHYYRGGKEEAPDTRKYRGGGRGNRDSKQ